MEERVIVTETERRGSTGRLKTVCWVFAVIAIISEILLIWYVVTTGNIKDEKVILESALTTKTDENYRLSQQVERLESLKESLEDEIEELSVKADFMDKYIKVVEDDEGKTYHKYGCEYFDDSYFWAYNINQVVDKSGYTRCPYCN